MTNKLHHVEGCHNLQTTSDRFGEPCDCATVPNLDAMTADELMTFWVEHQRGRGRARLGLHGRGSVNATADLANYASNKATAISCRLRGDITAATVYETIADNIYERLPISARW